MDVLVRAHVYRMNEDVEDRLQHYETSHCILQTLVVNRLGQHVDDVADPVKDPEDDAIPDEDLT